ncbi:MAG: hypothetical protein IPJ28_11105 [Betaproteobacteria bacterium]|nr:hypothetical protein [Betaproteobacteria bacterium]
MPQTWLVAAIVLAMVVSKVAAGWLGGIPPMLGDFPAVVFLFFLVASSTNTLARHHRVHGGPRALHLFLAVHGIDQSRTASAGAAPS